MKKDIKNKKIEENYDLIPYIYNVPENFSKKMKSYSPNSRNEKMGEDCIGSGISREVYVHPENENLVIKISKKYKKNNLDQKYSEQSKNEIFAFLNYPLVRKWMPQIYNYDKSNYNWIISERCENNQEKLKEILKEFDQKRLELILQTTKIEKDAQKKLFLPLRRRIELVISKIKKKQRISNNFRVKQFRYNKS